MDEYNKIEKLLKTSFSIFKDNYPQLILISAIQSLIGFYSYFIKSIDNSALMLLFIFAGLTIIYFSLRLSITTISFIKDRYDNIQSTVPESYIKSKEYLWNYLGASFMLVILVGMPAVLFYIGFILTSSALLKFLILIIGSILVIFLASNFFFMPTITVLEPNNNTSLNRSVEIAKKNRKTVIYFIAITLFLLFLPMIFSNLINTNAFLSKSFETLLMLFVSPLSACITVVFYCHITTNDSDIIIE